MQDFYDHLYFRATYPTPDLHSHFAQHIILADGGDLECNVAGKKFCCKGLMIQSNTPHTVSSKTGSMMVFLIEETCAREKLMDEKYIVCFSHIVDMICLTGQEHLLVLKMKW